MSRLHTLKRLRSYLGHGTNAASASHPTANPSSGGGRRRRPRGFETLESRCLLTGTFEDGQSVGEVLDSPLDDVAGLVASQRNDGLLWTHNSGNTNAVYALDSAANVLGTYTLQGSGAVDYEDIAVGPGPVEGTSYLFVGDIGDDTGVRAGGIVVYRVAEPEVTGPGSQVLSGVDAVTLIFPDGARDAETLLVDPQSGDLYVITKQDTFNRIYRAPAPGAGSQSITMQLMGQMDWTGAVAGDVSQSGLEILIKSPTAVYQYDRGYGQNLWEAIDAGSAFTNPAYSVETQGESISFDRQGEDYYTLSAAAGAPSKPLLFYARAGTGDIFEFQDGVSPSAAYGTGGETRDTELREAEAGTNFGASIELGADGDDPIGSGLRKNALLYWNISDIAAGMQVLDASVTLEITNTSSGGYEIFGLLKGWNEAQATWNDAATSQTWQSPGATGPSDRDPTPLGTADANSSGTLTVDLNSAGIARVQQWVDVPQSNHGLILASDATTDGMDFPSNEAMASNTRPKLSVRAIPSGAIPPQYAAYHNPRLQLGDAPLVGYSGSETDQVEILWQTMEVAAGNQDEFVVQYRRVGDTLWSTVGPVSTIDTGVGTRVNHFVEIDGLDYAADYEYRVSHLRGGNILQTFQDTFRTRLPAGDVTPFVFAAYGDSAFTPRVDDFRAVQAQINSSPSEFAILMGDTAYDDATHVEFDARFDPTLNPEAAEWIADHIDYLGFGAVEIDTDGGQPTRDNFSVPIPVEGVTAPFAPPPTEPTEHNFAFDYGLVHFVTFDTNSFEDANRLDQQLAYVENDLLSSNARWKIVYGAHGVAFSPDKPESPSDNYYQQVVPRLRAAGADLLMVGHSHTYSWTKPLLGYEVDGMGNATATFVDDGDKVYDKGAGLVQVVAGVGGLSVRDGTFVDPAIAAGFTNQTVPQGKFGFSQVEVSPYQITVKYVAAENRGLIDEFSIVTPPLPGDFNLDGLVDATDIDLLYIQVHATTPDLEFDLTGDSLVTQADVDELVVNILGTQYGDANLDGRVSLLDLDSLGQNFGQTIGWSGGDFSGDGSVSLIDLDILGQNFGFNSGGSSAVLATLTPVRGRRAR